MTKRERLIEAVENLGTRVASRKSAERFGLVFKFDGRIYAICYHASRVSQGLGNFALFEKEPSQAIAETKIERWVNGGFYQGD